MAHRAVCHARRVRLAGAAHPISAMPARDRRPATCECRGCGCRHQLDRTRSSAGAQSNRAPARSGRFTELDRARYRSESACAARSCASHRAWALVAHRDPISTSTRYSRRAPAFPSWRARHTSILRTKSPACVDATFARIHEQFRRLVTRHQAVDKSRRRSRAASRPAPASRVIDQHAVRRCVHALELADLAMECDVRHAS